MRIYNSALSPLRNAEFDIRSRLYLGRHAEERELVRGNIQLLNTHRGQRCFILGNGPSLANEDLSLLDGEVVFTVNNLKSGDLEGLPQPQYHVVADRRFFSVDPEVEQDVAMFNTLHEIFSGPMSPTCFVPTHVADSVRRRGFDVAGNIKYICEPYYFTDFYRVCGDIARAIPRFSSVVQRAIIIAVYLGFRRIYLLGCDATNIIANINSALKQSVQENYAFAVSRDLDQWLENQFAKRNMERCAEAYLEVLICYRYLYRYCSEIGVEMVNCSSQTVIDDIPRKSLSEVLS